MKRLFTTFLLFSPTVLAAPSGSKPVIVQMFEWTWNSVAAECTNFLGPAGYGFVQVSPAQEHIQGISWWTDYQPVSYNITSKRGTRAQYSSMISTCHTAGVKVIADTIFNHMAGPPSSTNANASGTGIAGTVYKHYTYPMWNASNFHYCGEPGNNIQSYDNRTEVQTCQLDSLSDLATDTAIVQTRLAQYANDLLSLGVDGLRLDASKNIAAADLMAITSRLNSAPYITQEVIYGYQEPIQPSEYVGVGDVQEFRYTSALLNAFSGGPIAGLQNLDNQGWIAGSSANVFVANHDTERGSGSLNFASPSNTYILASIFLLAHPYGTPTVLSSYTVTSYDGGAPNGGAGTCSGNVGTNGWICQHRLLPISGMTLFRNTVGTAAMNNWVSPVPSQIAFGRGSAGFVAINNADCDWSATFTTSLPSGRYCDVISGVSSSGVCTGLSFTVTNGKFTAVVPSRNAIAIHIAATGTAGSATAVSATACSATPVPSGFVAVSFIERASTVSGENMFLTGSLSQLASWSPSASLALSTVAGSSLWNITVNLPANASFEYKFIRKESDGSIIWQDDPDLAATVVASGVQTITNSWVGATGTPPSSPVSSTSSAKPSASSSSPSSKSSASTSPNTKSASLSASSSTSAASRSSSTSNSASSSSKASPSSTSKASSSTSKSSSASSSSAPAASSSMLPVTFYEARTTTSSEIGVFLYGNITQLGVWKSAKALAMVSNKASPVPTWSVTVLIPANTPFLYKFFRKQSSGSTISESNPNRSNNTAASGSLAIYNTWR